MHGLYGEVMGDGASTMEPGGPPRRHHCVHDDSASRPKPVDHDDRLDHTTKYPGERSSAASARWSRRGVLGLGLGAAGAALAALLSDVALDDEKQPLALAQGRGEQALPPRSSAPGVSSLSVPRPERFHTGQLPRAPGASSAPASTAASSTDPTTSAHPTTSRGPTSSSTAPSATQSPSTAPAPASALRYFAPAEGNALYLTVDDGWYPSAKVLDLMRAEHLPLTTFLISEVAADSREHFAYWRAFVDAGGVIQNHTVSHPWLTTLPQGAVEAQWAGASAKFAQWFGFRPTLGRPPYGAVDDAVWQAAANCGLEELVMWSAVDNGHGLETWNQGPLAPGTIVLMHWDPGLYENLRQVLVACEAQGLVPRPLPTTTWPSAST